MAAQTPKAPTNKTGAGTKPATPKKPALNRAQIKAMEARAASAARASAFARGEDVDERPGATTNAPRANRPTPRRSGVRAGAERSAGFSPAAPELSVRAEMEYQRRDLVRLLLLTAILLVVFVVLWFFLH